MPKIVVQSGRTGWYVRVLEAGYVKHGDELTLVDRPFPRWTIDVVNDLAYSRGGSTQETMDTSRELAECIVLAEGWREGFRTASR